METLLEIEVNLGKERKKKFCFYFLWTVRCHHGRNCLNFNFYGGAIIGS